MSILIINEDMTLLRHISFPINIGLQIDLKLWKLVNNATATGFLLFPLNIILIHFLIIFIDRMFSITLINFTRTIRLEAIDATSIVRKSLKHFNIFVYLYTVVVYFLNLTEIYEIVLVFEVLHVFVVQLLFYGRRAKFGQL
jgi:hypothetical protein